MTASLVVPPAVLLIGGGLVLPLLQGWLRRVAILVLPLATLYLIWQVPDGIVLAVPFLDYTLALVKGDALSRLFATIFAVMALAGGRRAGGSRHQASPLFRPRRNVRLRRVVRFRKLRRHDRLRQSARRRAEAAGYLL